MIEFHTHRVTLRSDLLVSGKVWIREGQTGVCTGDLPEEDMFAVWFNEPTATGLSWVVFNQEEKPLFIVGPVDEGFIQADAAAQAALSARFPEWARNK